MMRFVDTHTHIDGKEFDSDRAEVIARAKDAGVCKMLVPAIDLPSSQCILHLCRQYDDYLYPMVGLHPEEVKADWREQLAGIKLLLNPVPGFYPGQKHPHGVNHFPQCGH
jgi:TatD DNase family protein